MKKGTYAIVKYLYTLGGCDVYDVYDEFVVGLDGDEVVFVYYDPEPAENGEYVEDRLTRKRCERDMAFYVRDSKNRSLELNAKVRIDAVTVIAAKDGYGMVRHAKGIEL